MLILNASHAACFALERHGAQLYAGLPYAYHLSRVAYVAADFGYTDDVMQSICWLHDTIEDTGTDANEIQAKFGRQVRDGVWACTGIGANRVLRNLDIAEKLRRYSPGCVPKTCDRIANHEQTIMDSDTSKARMYSAEEDDFLAQVRRNIPPEMLSRLLATYEKLASIR